MLSTVKTVFLSLVVGLLFWSNALQANDPQKPMPMVVSPAWLVEHMDEPNLVILDASVLVKFNDQGVMESISGYDNYLQTHIPGARFADLLHKLSDQSNDLQNVMPSPEDFGRELGALGISIDSRVVIYSQENHVWAARLWWMLDWVGHRDKAILDGGLAAWQAANYPVAKTPVAPKPAQYQVKLNSKLVAVEQDVHAAIADDQTLLIDTMPEAHYNGSFALYMRAGHIPTAINIGSNTMVNDKQQFNAADEVELFIDGNKDRKIITYCGGGVAASSVAFNLRRAGFTNVSVYMGSLQEWTQKPENPMSSDP